MARSVPSAPTRSATSSRRAGPASRSRPRPSTRRPIRVSMASAGRAPSSR
jgi:hypothetical protein